MDTQIFRWEDYGSEIITANTDEDRMGGKKKTKKKESDIIPRKRKRDWSKEYQKRKLAGTVPIKGSKYYQSRLKNNSRGNKEESTDDGQGSEEETRAYT